MNSPLVSKNSLGSGFFEVAAPPKPYYNPANLEKAGSRVKRKEFLQAISKSNGAPAAAHQRSGAPGGHFLFRVARLGSDGPGFAATHAKPLPSLRGGRCSPATARRFFAPRPRPESRGHRARIETPGRRLGAGGKCSSAWAAFSAAAHAAWTVARTSGARHESLRWLSQRARTRANALLYFHAAPHRAVLPHQYPLAL